MAALTCFVLVLPFTAYWRNVEMMDQSGNNHFRQYALAVLDTLPQDSLLFANYDQQWTSIRYLQECEGHRKDVTSINLSMMTYSWWDVKRDLYDEIHFPGTHYTRGNSRPWLEGGFTFSGDCAVRINAHFASPQPQLHLVCNIHRKNLSTPTSSVLGGTSLLEALSTTPILSLLTHTRRYLTASSVESSDARAARCRSTQRNIAQRVSRHGEL